MKFILDTKNLKLNLEEYFPDAIDKYLETYFDYLKSKNVKREIISNVQEFHNNIHMSLIEYYYGQHGSSRFFFNRALAHVDIKVLCTHIREKIFYRARFNKDGLHDKVYTADEMFHIPLNKRYLVSTERYSFPGLPCLYLGTSPEVCCVELDNYDDNLSVAIIKSKKADIHIIDLAFFDKFDIYSLDSELRDKIYKLWPIVACCSFSYNKSHKAKSEIKFRPDYIIPQLLLEYIVDKNFDNSMSDSQNDIVGIRYRTVKKPFFDLKGNMFDNKYVNYVFPALSSEKIGHCSKLKAWFEITHVSKLKELIPCTM